MTHTLKNTDFTSDNVFCEYYLNLLFYTSIISQAPNMKSTDTIFFNTAYTDINVYKSLQQGVVALTILNKIKQLHNPDIFGASKKTTYDNYVKSNSMNDTEKKIIELFKKINMESLLYESSVNDDIMNYQSKISGHINGNIVIHDKLTAFKKYQNDAKSIYRSINPSTFNTKHSTSKSESEQLRLIKNMVAQTLCDLVTLDTGFDPLKDKSLDRQQKTIIIKCQNEANTLKENKNKYEYEVSFDTDANKIVFRDVKSGEILEDTKLEDLISCEQIGLELNDSNDNNICGNYFKTIIGTNDKLFNILRFIGMFTDLPLVTNPDGSGKLHHYPSANSGILASNDVTKLLFKVNPIVFKKLLNYLDWPIDLKNDPKLKYYNASYDTFNKFVDRLKDKYPEAYDSLNNIKDADDKRYKLFEEYLNSITEYMNKNYPKSLNEVAAIPSSNSSNKKQTNNILRQIQPQYFTANTNLMALNRANSNRIYANSVFSNKIFIPGFAMRGGASNNAVDNMITFYKEQYNGIKDLFNKQQKTLHKDVDNKWNSSLNQLEKNANQFYNRYDILKKYLINNSIKLDPILNRSEDQIEEYNKTVENLIKSETKQIKILGKLQHQLYLVNN